MLARCEEPAAPPARRFHYGLVALHARVQMAAAYCDCMASGPRPGLLWQQALARGRAGWLLDARCAEQYTAIWPRCWRRAAGAVPSRVVEPGDRILGQQVRGLGAPSSTARQTARAIAAALTEKELALARLVAQRRTNKEIAETLHLSEGTVKQYINQLYAKLDIGGAVRNKRAQLAALFGTKY